MLVLFFSKVRNKISEYSAKGKPVAMAIVEPIQGEGGDRYASAYFFTELQKILKKVVNNFCLTTENQLHYSNGYSTVISVNTEWRVHVGRRGAVRGRKCRCLVVSRIVELALTPRLRHIQQENTSGWVLPHRRNATDWGTFDVQLKNWVKYFFTWGLLGFYLYNRHIM